MEYEISQTVFGISLEIIDKYIEKLTFYLKSNFEFENSDFEMFFLILQLIPENRASEFGPDRLQVSKKEKCLFLGVNLVNERFVNKAEFNQLEFDYIISRVFEVKSKNLKRLKGLGMIE
jgi:hypothetical protein